MKTKQSDQFSTGHFTENIASPFPDEKKGRSFEIDELFPPSPYPPPGKEREQTPDLVNSRKIYSDRENEVLAIIDKWEHFDKGRWMTSIQKNIDTGLKLLQKFYNTHGEDVHRLRKLLDDDMYEEANQLVHTLKGASGTLGWIVIQQQAILCERELRVGQPCSEDNLNALEQALAQAIQSIRDILPIAKEKLDRPNSPPLSLSILKKLEQLLTESDSRASRLFHELSPQLQIFLGKDFAEMQKKIGVFDYENALEMLRIAMKSQSHLLVSNQKKS